MPTNLPPECTLLEQKYLEAQTTSEKIETLEKYLAAIPKHKGTERLCARIKTKLAKLRLEHDKKRRRSLSSIGSKFSIKKEGAAQVIILGFTGAGRSSLLKILTNAKPAIYDYPFTTTEPIPGMMSFEDVQIQLVEAPALFKGASEGDGWGAKVLGLARNADGLVIIVDLTASTPHHQLETIIDELTKSHIAIEEKKGEIEIEKKKGGGIQVVSFCNLDFPISDIKDLVRKTGIDHAVVKIWGDVDVEDISQALFHNTLFKPAIIIANKLDITGSEETLKSLRNAFSDLNILGTSTTLLEGVADIPRRIFEMLSIVRVYTKRPKQKPSRKPIILSEGVTVGDAAKMIHKVFYKDFKYARIWGSSNYPGERVGINYILKDKDIIEIRTAS